MAVLFPSVHPCNEVKCSIRSYLLHTQANTSSKSLLRVDVDNNGVPTGVSVTGQGSQSKYTSRFSPRYSCVALTIVVFNSNVPNLIVLNVAFYMHLIRQFD